MFGEDGAVVRSGQLIRRDCRAHPAKQLSEARLTAVGCWCRKALPAWCPTTLPDARAGHGTMHCPQALLVLRAVTDRPGGRARLLRPSGPAHHRRPRRRDSNETIGAQLAALTTWEQDTSPTGLGALKQPASSTATTTRCGTQRPAPSASPTAASSSITRCSCSRPWTSFATEPPGCRPPIGRWRSEPANAT
jgi:hypothetical protein